MVKNLPKMWETWVWSLGQEDPLEKAMAPHSSILSWKIPQMEEPGGLQPMGSLSWTWLSDFTFNFHFHALEKEMATHSSVLAWRIPGTEEPGELPSMGLKGCCWITTPGFLASRGEEFNPGPETRLDRSELLCNKVLLKYKGDRESFWHRHQKEAERVPPC